MNITRSFVTWMESKALGTFQTDIFIGGAPLDATDRIWWVLSSGGNSIIKAQTGEKLKQYRINVFFRDTNAESVYDTMQAFEELVNDPNCDQLDGYETIEMEATLFPSDQDLDSEDRTIGIVEVTLSIYKK